MKRMGQNPNVVLLVQLWPPVDIDPMHSVELAVILPKVKVARIVGPAINQYIVQTPAGTLRTP